MAGFSVNSNEHLIRSNLWSNQIKEVLLDELMGMRYVDMITDFPDGDTINIPSIGQMEVNDYAEGQPIKYTGMDTGNFTFTQNKYKSSATYIYDKFKQDSFYAGRVTAKFVPASARAIAKAMEVDILTTAPDGQTASSLNTINGGNHRFVAGGTNQVISIQDFQRARFALQKANVPMTNLVAIVDPSVEYELATLTNLVNVSNNPQWEGIIRDGMSTGMQFKFNIYGWDVYISQNLKQGMSETINSVAVSSGVANLFFSAANDVLPIVGLVRQPPRVESFRNIDLQRDQYVTTCRYGFKLFRPENMVVVLTATNQVT